MAILIFSLICAAALALAAHPKRARLLYALRNWKAHARFVLLGGTVEIPSPSNAKGVIVATSELRAVAYKIPRKRRFFGLLEGEPLFAVPDDFGEWSEIARNEWSLRHCVPVDLGVIGRRVITTAGVNYIRDAFVAHNGGADVQLMNYHDSGTSSTAEAIGDTDLVTPAGPTTRATGVQDRSTSAHYKSVGTITYAGSVAVVEHGLFNQAARGAGSVLLDRTVFSVVNMGAGESIAFTYDLSLPAGS